MKKQQTKKLQINRETLILLEKDLRKINGGAPPPTGPTGESVCWCYT